MASNLVDLAAVLDAVRAASTSSASHVHGDSHWRRVATNGLNVAGANGADPLLVALFGIFHDSMRVNDDRDPGHGKRGGALALSMNERLLQLTDDQIWLLVAACDDHTDGKTSDDPTIGACWDADRLDLCRLGMRIDPAAMSTVPGRSRAFQEDAVALLGAAPDWTDIFERVRAQARGTSPS